MPVIEARFEGLEFPPCCCGCGSRAFKWRSHTDSVIVWTVIAVTKSRSITLPMPACDDCVRRPWLFYLAGAAVLALAFAFALIARPEHEFGLGIVLVIAAGIGLIVRGVASRPLKIIAYDADDRMVKLRIRSEEMARRLLALRGNYESEHHFFRKGWMIAACVVALPFVLLILSVGRPHG